MLDWARGAVEARQGLHRSSNLEELAGFGSFDSNHLSLVRADGAMDLYHGNLRAIDAAGQTIFDQVDYQDYARRTSPRRCSPGPT